jgi:type II secretory pathway component GspD/PulD (secretin)
MLVNLTSEHINWITSVLAADFNGDIVTAPEVVTLNGQNVEFIAGAKVPFEIGQNVVVDNTNNIQQFFYKHVGTYISVTPQIVNWGHRHEGRGAVRPDYETEKKATAATRSSCAECDWKANECTIDLAIVARLSGSGKTTVQSVDRDGQVSDREVTIEDNVRAIANIVQVKSGEGVVMAGLIGERDVEVVSKVPILGDIPLAGALFRSKQADRAKTETLIFVEARVLDSDPRVSRYQSHEDFHLASDYVAGDLSSNPLARGMYRSGFGSYLPPHSKSERVFWERFGRRVRNVVTTIDDLSE